MASLGKIFPWQQGAWQMVQNMILAERLPHALLITGKQGTGISEFASHMAYSVLCFAPLTDGEPCGQCQSCELLRADTHPDFLLMTPWKDEKNIKIEKIRELMVFSQHMSHYGNYKVIIIDSADAMNANASNALLKTLEEPPGNTLLILVTEQPGLLPVTIKSRCQKIQISASSVHIKSWLNGDATPELVHSAIATGYGPLFFEEQADIDVFQSRLSLIQDLEEITTGQSDPVDVAELWSRKDIKQVFFWLTRITQDLIRIKILERFSRQPNDLIDNKSLEELQQLTNCIDIKSMINIYDQLLKTCRLTAQSSNLKPQTLCEDITLQWSRMSKSVPSR